MSLTPVDETPQAVFSLLKGQQFVMVGDLITVTTIVYQRPGNVDCGECVVKVYHCDRQSLPLVCTGAA